MVEGPYPEHTERMIRGVQRLREENKKNPVVNVSFQTRLPDNVSIDDFAEAIEAHLHNVPLDLRDGGALYNWTECVSITRSRSSR